MDINSYGNKTKDKKTNAQQGIGKIGVEVRASTFGILLGICANVGQTISKYPAIGKPRSQTIFLRC